jgi:sortase family protein
VGDAQQPALDRGLRRSPPPGAHPGAAAAARNDVLSAGGPAPVPAAPAAPAPAPVAPAPAARVPAAPAPARPTPSGSLVVPGVDLRADHLDDLGTGPAGELQVPADPQELGWFAGSAVPGQSGPAVVVGHVDSWQGPGVFRRLRDLHAGDPIDVPRSDGTVAHFVVDSVESFDKDAFPTQHVYGPTPGPSLRLVTCSRRAAPAPAPPNAAPVTGTPPRPRPPRWPGRGRWPRRATSSPTRSSSGSR